MAAKLTPWFPASVAPKRKGIYEVHCADCDETGQSRWSLWTGKHWMSALLSREAALQASCESFDMLSNFAMWRGRARRPSKG